MSLKIGDIYAELGLDKTSYDKDLAVAKREGETFSHRKFTASAGLDAAGLRTQASAAVTQVSGQLRSAGQSLTKGVTAPLRLDKSSYDKDLATVKRKASTEHIDIPVRIKDFATGQIDGLKGKLKDLLSSWGPEMAVAAGAAVVTGIAYSIGLASNLNETVNKMQVVFGAASQSITDWAANASEKLMMTSQQAMEAAATFGNLFVSMGYGQTEAAGMSMNLVQLAADLSSFNNVPIDQALEAIRAGLIGETEPLRQFGVMIDEAALKAQALAMGLDVSGATLTPLVRSQAAYALILKQTGTAQGDVARTAGSFANQSKILAANLNEAATALGKKLLPAATQFLNGLNNIIQAIPKIEMNLKRLAGPMGALVDQSFTLGTNFDKLLKGDWDGFLVSMMKSWRRIIEVMASIPGGDKLFGGVLDKIDLIISQLEGSTLGNLYNESPPISAHGLAADQAAAAADAAAAGGAVTAAVEKTSQDVAAAGAGLVGTLATIPKNAKQILARDWDGIAAGVRSAGDQLLSAFADMSSESLAEFSKRTGFVGSIAGALGAVATVLVDMPKKAIAPAHQNWTALATMLRSSMNSILNVFLDFTDKQLGKNADRMGVIGSAAGGLGSFVSALAELPKKAIAPTRQAWTALSLYLASAIDQILAIFENTKGLGKQAERAGSIGSLAGGLGSFIGALAGLPDKAVAVIPQKWGALAKVLDTAVTQVLKVFEDVTSKSLGKDAGRMGSVGSMAGGLGSLISALVSLPDKAVTVVPQKWKALAKVVRDAVTEVLKVFEDVTTKQLGKDAGRAGSVSGMAGSLGSLLGLFVSGPEAAAKIVPQKWHELALAVKDAVREVLDAYKGVNDDLLKQQGTTMGLIGQVVGPLASILDFFANAPATAITVVRQNWAALTATLIEAVAQVVTQFNAVWTTDQLKGNAETMGFVGTMVSTIGSIVDLVSSLPDQLGALEKFSMKSGSLGGIWQGVGNALLQIVNALATALDQIPDMTRLAAAQQAVSTLRDIFSSMADLSKSMGGQLSAGVSGGVALGVAGGGGTVITVTVPLQSMMGTPSDAELDSVARRLKPYLTGMAQTTQRTTFG